jgi:hypothetical protein
MFFYHVLVVLLSHQCEAALKAMLDAPPEAGDPHLVPLRRESVPVRRHGKIASFKTSYSGVISVGSPKRQEFRVVFDTGSGHVVLPALECRSETCLAHRRYDMSASKTAVMVNTDGEAVQPGEYADQATIGFGTGEITGEFAKDVVCLGAAETNSMADHSQNQNWSQSPCLNVSLIMAIEMSAQPFKSFAFDGILGLGLSGLALSPSFSFFDVLTKNAASPRTPHFAVYLTEAEDDEESEVAIGGYNVKRLLEPLSWSPVAKKELGYWQVHINAIRINGVTLDICQDGTCHGVVDTGSSHLGVPAPYDKDIAARLTQEASDILDCRLAAAPVIEIELPGVNLTISAETYMRRLPLREGVSVGSTKGVSMTPAEMKQVGGAQEEIDRMSALSVNVTTQPGGSKDAGHADVPHPNNSSDAGKLEDSGQTVKRFCRPKMMPVSLPAPLGPKLFILGEPVLHRYYTVYDRSAPRIGFGLAASRRNVDGPLVAGADRRGSLPEGVDTILMQQRLHVDVDNVDTDGWSDDVAIFSQVTISIISATPKHERF